jgi:hypothetical protein
LKRISKYRDGGRAWRQLWITHANLEDSIYQESSQDTDHQQQVRKLHIQGCLSDTCHNFSHRCQVYNLLPLIARRWWALDWL